MPSIILKVPRTAKGVALESDKSGLIFRKELIYENVPGETFRKKTAEKDQTFTVDSDRLDYWADTGNTMIQNGVKVPVPLKHTDDPEKNRGQIVRFERGLNDDGREALFGVVKFRDQEAAKLAASTDVSIFVPDKPVYDGLGREYIHPIRHVCCTDYPVIPKLGGFEAIAASLELDVSGVVNKGIKYLAEGVKKHPIVTGAGVIGTGAWLHNILKKKKYKGVSKQGGKASDKLKVGTGAAIAGSGGVLIGHGLREFHHAATAAKGGGKAALASAAFKGAMGIKSALFGQHLLHQAKHIVVGEHSLSHEIAPHRIMTIKAIKGGVALAQELNSKKKKSRGYHARLAGLHSVLAAISGVPAAAALTAIGMSEQPKLQKVRQALVPLVSAAFAAYDGLHAAKHGYKAVVGGASLELDHNHARRDSSGVFRENPNSKASMKRRLKEFRQQAASSQELLGGGSGGEQHNPMHTYASALKHGKSIIHDFYTADKGELNSGSNLLHATKHYAVAIPHALLAGTAIIHGLRRGKLALKALSPKALQSVAAHAALAGTALLGADLHVKAATQHLYHAAKGRKKS